MDMPVDVPMAVVAEAPRTAGVTVQGGMNWMLDYTDDASPVLLVRHEVKEIPPPAPPAPPPVELTRVTVYFPTGQASIPDRDMAGLKSAASGRYAVVGYADPRGTKRFNQKLSEQRAAAVASVLRSVGAEPVIVTGYGEKDAQSKGDRAAYPLDRRVELKPIEGD